MLVPLNSNDLHVPEMEDEEEEEDTLDEQLSEMRKTTIEESDPDEDGDYTAETSGNQPSELSKV